MYLILANTRSRFVPVFAEVSTLTSNTLQGWILCLQWFVVSGVLEGPFILWFVRVECIIYKFILITKMNQHTYIFIKTVLIKLVIYFCNDLITYSSVKVAQNYRFKLNQYFFDFAYSLLQVGVEVALVPFFFRLVV